MIQDVHPGSSRIPDPDFFPIPDPVVKKAPDPASRIRNNSLAKYLFYYNFGFVIYSIGKNPHWDCITLWRSAPLFLVTAAQRRISPGCRGPRFEHETYLASGALTPLPFARTQDHIPNLTTPNPTLLCHNLLSCSSLRPSYTASQ
jgi:hypothetical protein